MTPGVEGRSISTTKTAATETVVRRYIKRSKVHSGAEVRDGRENRSCEELKIRNCGPLPFHQASNP